MNGYSPYAQSLSDAQLAAEIRDVAPDAKYSGPAQDIHWLYRALLEEKHTRQVFEKPFPFGRKSYR